jgi:hypothetical protein
MNQQLQLRGERRGDPRLRAAALGVAVVGVGILAAALWTAAARAEAAASEGREEEAEFSAFIDDLPIMPGLSERIDGYAVGLTEGGRLAEARLAGNADGAVVRGFYAAALRQLGWEPSTLDPYVYHRQGERLVFLIEPRRARGGRGVEAVFLITPEPLASADAATR